MSGHKDYPLYKEAVEYFKDLDKPNPFGINSTPITKNDQEILSKVFINTYLSIEILKRLDKLEISSKASTSAGPIVPAGSNLQGRYQHPPTKGIKRKWQP